MTQQMSAFEGILLKKSGNRAKIDQIDMARSVEPPVVPLA
jgi:hypothetical protein